MLTETTDKPASALAEYSPTAQALAELRQRLKDRAYDLSTTKGDREARADRLELVRLRTSLEAKRKELKAPALERSRLIDTEAKRITDEILALETPIDEQIKAAEAAREAERKRKAEAEAARVAGIQKRIAEIRAAAYGHATAHSARLFEAIAAVEAMDVGTDGYAEFSDAAAHAKAETIAALQELFSAAKAREGEAARLVAERAELARLRTEQEAAARAERERQAAETARIQAEQSAERQRLAAEAAAQRAEAQRLADEAARIAAAEQRAREQEAARIVAEQEAQRRHDAAELALKAREAQQKEFTEGQAPQQVLKAEGASPDATDRDMPADTSPRVGAMGAGQAADAAPSVVVAIHESATLNLGAISARLGFTLSAQFVGDTLRVQPAATDKAAKLYRESQFAQIVMALQGHLTRVLGEKRAA